MNPTDLAEATKPAITAVSSNFMVDGPTYQRGAELGFNGADFYVAGRGGVLGDVIGDVVAAAFVFFEPGMVCDAWERSSGAMSRLDAGKAFAECGYAWARAHLADVDAASLTAVVDLGGKVVAAVNPAGAPVFAAWRGLEPPEDLPSRALHVLNALRELRAAYHGGAVLAAGLAPAEALAVNNPAMAVLFGWSELPAAEGCTERWEQAEAATNVAMGRALSVLSSDESGAFVDACAVVLAAV